MGGSTKKKGGARFSHPLCCTVAWYKEESLPLSIEGDEMEGNKLRTPRQEALRTFGVAKAGGTTRGVQGDGGGVCVGDSSSFNKSQFGSARVAMRTMMEPVGLYVMGGRHRGRQVVHARQEHSTRLWIHMR